MNFWQKILLFFSYQRYAFLLFPISLFLLIFPYLLLPKYFLSWIIIIPLGITGLFVFFFSMNVAFQYPRKIRATKTLFKKISDENFSSANIKSYCKDPCWRVVADTILKEASIGKTERKKIILSFKEELLQESKRVVLIDKKNGISYSIGDN